MYMYTYVHVAVMHNAWETAPLIQLSYSLHVCNTKTKLGAAIVEAWVMIK